jgi:predicted dehydrogenase
MIEGREAKTPGQMLRCGMVGGGPGSFIGGVHRAALGLDNSAQLVAGCFSRDGDKNRQTGEALRIADDRVYADFETMALREGQRDDPIDFVIVTTPNSSHYAACKAFLEQGIHVMCEKPLTVTASQALELRRLARERGCLFAVAYAYTGHVMVREARAIIRRGDIGDVLVVMGEYPQDWLIDRLEDNQKQAAWGTDPAQAGASNCTGDIGTHIENMVSYLDRPSHPPALRQPGHHRRGTYAGHQRGNSCCATTTAPGAATGVPRSRSATTTASKCASTGPRARSSSPGAEQLSPRSP